MRLFLEKFGKSPKSPISFEKKHICISQKHTLKLDIAISSYQSHIFVDKVYLWYPKPKLAHRQQNTKWSMYISPFALQFESDVKLKNGLLGPPPPLQAWRLDGMQIWKLGGLEA